MSEPLTSEALSVLRTLDQIGGLVAESEIAYQRGKGAPVECFELAEQGLVEVQTAFTLTAEGRRRIEGET